MGFLGQTSIAKPFPVTILAAGFQVRGTLQCIGLLQTFLNDEQKAVFSLQEVALYGVEQGNPAASMTLPELHIRKDQCQVIAFESELAREETGLLPRTEPLATYTSHYVVQGEFHMGPEAFVADFLDITKSMFIGATKAYIFPLFQAQSAVIQQAPLVYVHRDAVAMHHKV